MPRSISICHSVSVLAVALSGSDSRCFMRSTCTASGPANSRCPHTGPLRQCVAVSSGPFWQSRCFLRSTVPAHTGCPHTMCPPSGTSRRVHAAAPLYPALQGARTPHACARRSLSGRRPPRVAFVHVPRQDMFILAGRRRIGQRPAHQVQHGPCAVWPALARRWRALSIPTWSHRVPT